MTTREPGQTTCEAFYRARDNIPNPEHIWTVLPDRERSIFAKAEEAVRQPLMEEIHALKLAAAGGEDVPGAANLVTVDDIVRYRVEAAEEIERLRVLKNGLESSLRGSVRAADEMRAQLSARWSLIKRMRQDVEGLGFAVPPGAAQEWRNAYLAAWNGHNHLDAAGAGIRAVLRIVGASLIERWPATDQDGEPSCTPFEEAMRESFEEFPNVLAALKEDDSPVAPSLTNPNPKREGANQARHLTVNEPTERAADAIYVHDEDDNDIATFFHSEHATVGQDYETALRLATLLVEANNGGGASACPSLGDPVRVALGDEAIEAASAAFYDSMIGPETKFWPHHDGWNGKTENFKERIRGRMKLALRAALSVSIPTGEGGGLEGDTEQRDEGGRVTVLPTVLWRALDAEADIWVQETDVTGWIAKMSQDGRSREKIEAIVRLCFEEGFYRGAVAARDRRSIHDSLEGAAALAHPQQGGERDGWKPIAEARHDCTLYELEVPSDGKGLRDAETSITIGSNNGDHDGEDRWTYAGWSWCQDRYIHMDTADGAPMPIRFREIRPDHLGRSASEPDPAVAPSDKPDLSYSGAPMPPDGIEGCIYCGQPFKEGDLVLNEYEGGLGHIGCFGPERESYVGRDGEPLRDDEPIPTGRPWTPTSPSKSSGEEA